MNVVVVSIIAVNSVVSIETEEAHIATSDYRDKVDFKVPQKKWLNLSSKKGTEKHFPGLTAADLEEAAKGCCPKNTQ